MTLNTPLVGNLIYVIAARMDLSFVANHISRFMKVPKVEQLTTTKRILRYLMCTLKFGITYGKWKHLQLPSFIDSNWAYFSNDRKSTDEYSFKFSTDAISWLSRKQQAVALSSTKHEYRATIVPYCEMFWLQMILSDFHVEQDDPNTLHCNKQSVLKLEYLFSSLFSSINVH